MRFLVKIALKGMFVVLLNKSFETKMYATFIHMVKRAKNQAIDFIPLKTIIRHIDVKIKQVTFFSRQKNIKQQLVLAERQLQ